MSKEPMTMFMASIRTGVMRASICRYVAEWEENGEILLVEKKKCVLTKKRAGWYTTNKDFMKELEEARSAA